MHTAVSSSAATLRPASIASVSASGPVAGVRTEAQSAEGSRGLAALLLAAAVAAMVVVADQVIESWVDGHVFLAWVLLWAVVFAATLVFAGTARRMAQRSMAGLNRWSQQAAQRRADARLWTIAKTDARVMGELVAAQQRATPDTLPSVEALSTTPAAAASAAALVAAIEMRVANVHRVAARRPAHFWD